MLSIQTPRTIRILIVEDEGIIARDLSAILHQLGFAITGQAGSGAEALRLLSTASVDLVLMDIKIRGPMDGIETAALIHHTHRVPVVFLTAHADAETLRRANRTEPFGYIVKPFSASDIRVAVEVALNRYRLQSVADARQEHFRSALCNVSEAVVATDCSGEVAFLNPAAEELTGFTSEQALGQPVSNVLQLFDPATGLALLGPGLPLAFPEATSSANASLRHKQGGEQPVVASVVALKCSGSDQALGYAAVVRPDIGLLQGHPGRSDQQLQELSYHLSNDLREPVRNIGCFAELLERQSARKLDDDSREYLDFIVQGSRRMENQISSLRRFYQAGVLPAGPAGEADANTVCQQVLLALQPAIQQAGATVTVGGLPIVQMSASALEEIFQILVSNSLRFQSDRRLCVSIDAVPSGNFWLFRCQDNGLGFEPDQKERIFNLFTKAHGPHISGNGIGLAICRRLVETAGGRLWAESVYGSHSTFFFTAPAPRPARSAA